MKITTLHEARAIVRNNLDDGIQCPCCDQFCKRYRRKLNSQMARWLIWLYRRASGSEWVTVRESPVRGGDYAKLALWGLVEQKSNDDETKRTSGVWRITKLGRDFVDGHRFIPSHVMLYNNTIHGWSRACTTIRHALGERFDYAELMGQRDINR
jgi:hypothetical protein